MPASPHRPQPFWRIALPASLLFHALLAYVMGWLPAAETPPAPLPPPSGPIAFLVDEKSEPTGVLVRRPLDPAPEPAPLPVLEKPAKPAPAAPSAPAVPNPRVSHPDSAGGNGPAGPGSGLGQADPTSPATATIAPGTPGTTFFNVATSARKIVYVIDRSGSMGRHGAWTCACQELLASLRRLPADVRFQIIVYNHTPRLLLGHGSDWLTSKPSRVRETEIALARLAVEGATDHGRALRAALVLRPEAIFFLTDGDDLAPELVRHICQLNRASSAIHAIELTTARSIPAGTPLQMLARSNAGIYQAIALGAYP